LNVAVLRIFAFGRFQKFNRLGVLALFESLFGCVEGRDLWHRGNQGNHA
jgi:hypothetical protein